MKLTKEIALDSARFANFSMRVKMNYWSAIPREEGVAEGTIDSILLLAWVEFKNHPL